MNVVIPPLIFYVLGVALLVAGMVRAWSLGLRHASRELADDDPRKASARRRHLAFGVVWILMGVFLIASTAGVLRSRAVAPKAAFPGTPRATSPVIRLSPDERSTISPPPEAR
jgi:hypothetical protein